MFKLPNTYLKHDSFIRKIGIFDKLHLPKRQLVLIYTAQLASAIIKHK